MKKNKNLIKQKSQSLKKAHKIYIPLKRKTKFRFRHSGIHVCNPSSSRGRGRRIAAVQEVRDQM
jgi:hypothetical protein